MFELKIDEYFVLSDRFLTFVDIRSKLLEFFSAVAKKRVRMRRK